MQIDVMKKLWNEKCEYCIWRVNGELNWAAPPLSYELSQLMSQDSLVSTYYFESLGTPCCVVLKDGWTAYRSMSRSKEIINSALSSLASLF